MHYLEGERVAEVLKGVISQKHQQHHHETDLTVRSVHRITGGGAIDFGGSEEVVAPREKIEPKKASPDDKYGWWQLPAGSYVLTFNEVPELGEKQIAFIQPHERLVRAGATHPSYYFRGRREVVETTILVGSGGINIKENARVSKLLILQIDS
jgi:deoxycytidine triphosphate deaminase